VQITTTNNNNNNQNNKNKNNIHFTRTIWANQYQKGRTIMDFTEARDDGMEVASAGPYANVHLAPDR